MKKLIKLSLILFTIQLLLTGIFAQTDQKAELVVQLGHSNIVGAVAFSPDGHYIVTGDSYAKVLILWETASGKEIRRFIGHDDSIIAVAYSHNGNYVASVSKDKTLRKWDVLTGRELVKINLFKDCRQRNYCYGKFDRAGNFDKAVNRSNYEIDKVSKYQGKHYENQFHFKLRQNDLLYFDRRCLFC